MRNVYFKKGTISFMVLITMLCAIPSSIGFKQDLKPLFLYDGNILYVGGSGEGNYTRIQDAIDNASVGDTVFVYDDSSPYYECLFLNKTLSLVGEDRDTTVVDALHKGSVVLINVDGCLVSGFTLKNCMRSNYNSRFDVVKIVDCDNVTVRDNILSIGEMEMTDMISVVELYNSCYCTISGNIIFELDWVRASSGVEFISNSCYNTISNNVISNYVWGIRFEWYGSCDGNIISGNHISNSTFGINIHGCNDNKILNNAIKNNRVEGIGLTDAKNTVISGNIIRYNGEGHEFECGIILVSEDCCYNTVSGNIISNNNPTGIFICYAFDNVIKENNFIDNYGPNGGSPEKCWGNAYFGLPFKFKSLFHANSWDSNFWSDYKGFGMKIIPGDIEILVLMFGWFQFDWHPAKEPHDI